MGNATMSSTVLPTPNNPITLKPHYDLVIVGSGLGAAVLAVRFSAAGKTVAIFEPQQTIGTEAGQATFPFAHEPTLFSNKALPTTLRSDASGLALGLSAAERFAKAAGTGATEAALTAIYLGDAAARGVFTFVGFDPKNLSTHASGYKLGFQIEGVGRDRYDAPDLFVTAANIAVAHGSAAGAFLKLSGITLSNQVGATCAMGDNGGQSATDHLGRLWKGNGNECYGNLFAAGRTLCSAELGTCPTLSFAAISERQATSLLASLGVASKDAEPLPCPPPPVAPGLRFTEAMKGFVSNKVTAAGAFESGFRLGKEEDSPLVFVLTLATDNVDAMERDPQHPARSVGTVVAPALDPKPLLVAGGDFNLFVDQADGSQRMKYRMQLVAESGRRFFFDGFKVIRNDPGLDLWPDTTTLYVTVFDGPTDQSPIWGRGVLHILPKDFASQLLTFHATNARNKWQQTRAEMGFYRLFVGTLFETYAGFAQFLPDVRKPGGIMKMLAAKLGLLLLTVVALLFWIWPWRPSILRNQPQLEARPRIGMQQAATDVEQLKLFPQLLDGLKTDPGSTNVQAETYHCSWVPDNLVQTHGGLGEIPYHPTNISVLSELAIKRAFVNLTRIRDGAGRVVGIGSQVETVILSKGAVMRTAIDAYTDWSLTFPGRGTLFLGQVEGGPDLASLQAEAAKTGQPWRGLREINHTLGPLTDGRGIIHAGTGAFRDVVGAFKEFNILKEVPAHGDMVADSRYELSLVHAQDSETVVPEQARELDLPAQSTRRLKRDLAWRTVKRSFSVELAKDTIYSTGGTEAGNLPFPESLGYLTDPALNRVRVFLGKLRDEHGEVTGLAGASSAPNDRGSLATQWTLTIAGAGTLHVAAEDVVASPTVGSYLGRQRGFIVGGTGAFANATGVVHERWPTEGSGVLSFEVTLVSN
jgi:choline dehydrogenase-like flavoprotein